SGQQAAGSFLGAGVGVSNFCGTRGGGTKPNARGSGDSRERTAFFGTVRKRDGRDFRAGRRFRDSTREWAGRELVWPIERFALASEVVTTIHAGEREEIVRRCR